MFKKYVLLVVAKIVAKNGCYVLHVIDVLVSVHIIDYFEVYPLEQ